MAGGQIEDWYANHQDGDTCIFFLGPRLASITLKENKSKADCKLYNTCSELEGSSVFTAEELDHEFRRLDGTNSCDVESPYSQFEEDVTGMLMDFLEVSADEIVTDNSLKWYEAEIWVEY